MISLDKITKQLSNNDLLEQLCGSVDADPSQVEKVAKLGLPTIMEALNRNTNDEAGATSLSNALKKHKGVDLDDLSGFFKNVDKEDGAKIISHIFGSDESKVSRNLAKSTGMSSSQVSGLLQQFAPLILSFLGNQEEEASNSGGISGLTSTLAGLFGNQNTGGGMNLLSLASSVLDNDDDDDNEGGGLLGGLLDSIF